MSKLKLKTYFEDEEVLKHIKKVTKDGEGSNWIRSATKSKLLKESKKK